MRGAAYIAFIFRSGRDDDGAFNANKHPQRNKHGVLDLFPYGNTELNTGEVQCEGIQFEHHDSQHNKRAER